MGVDGSNPSGVTKKKCLTNKSKVVSSVTWSVFSAEYFSEVKKELMWRKKTFLYMGDLSNVDMTTDWRFSDVEGKRRKCAFLGLIDNPEFPLKEPIETYRNNE